jgi:hypothetical protein
MLIPSLANVLSFLGPIGGPEIIMILLVLILLVGPAVVIVGVLLYMDRKKRASQLSSPPPPLPSTQVRLQELESLKAQGLVSEAEYQEKRQQILGGL